jgi:hypothetical protein
MVSSSEVNKSNPSGIATSCCALLEDDSDESGLGIVGSCGGMGIFEGVVAVCRAVVFSLVFFRLFPFFFGLPISSLGLKVQTLKLSWQFWHAPGPLVVQRTLRM